MGPPLGERTPKPERAGERQRQLQFPRWLLCGLGFGAGALGLGLAVVAFFSTMVLFLPAHLDVAMEQRAIAVLSLAHLPVIALEGLFTAMLVLFLQRVKPELLPPLPRRRHRPHRSPETHAESGTVQAASAQAASPASWQEGS